MNADPDHIDARRKRLLWRATHRGIKEMDLLLGGFVQSRLSTLSPAEIAELEAIIQIPDHDMLSWATGQAAIPAELASPLLKDILGVRP